MPAEYRFEDHVKRPNSKYIFQSVSHRRLSGICHSHAFYELILLLEGSVSHTVNGEEWLMRPGDCIVLTPQDTHRFTCQSEDLALVGLSVICEEFLSVGSVFGLTRFPSKETQRFSCTERLSELKAQSERCRAALDDRENKLLLSLLLSLCKGAQAESEAAIPSVLRQAVSQMNRPEHLKEGVSALVRLTNYSYPHLYRLIKQYYRVTPHALLLKLKLDAAYGRLLHSDLSVEEVAESVGFSSVSHFQQAFGRAFGLSPAKLRKQCGSAYF